MGNGVGLVQSDPVRGWLRIEETIDATAAHAPERVALVCGTRRWTYGALRAERDRRAGLLVAAGLGRGECIITAERASDELLIAFLACCRAGGVLANLSPLLTDSELAALTPRLRPRLALTATGQPHSGFAAIATLPVALPGVPSAIALREVAQRATVGSTEDPAMIRPTSGTTGALPKLVVRPHRVFTWRCGTPSRFARPDSVFASATANTLNLGEGCRIFAAGGTYVIAASVGAAGLEDELAACGATVLITTPALAGVLVRQEQAPPATLRLEMLRTLGAALPADIRLALERRYGTLILENYSMTECVGIIITQGAETPPGSAGKPYPDTEVRLLDEAGQPVPDGEVGELVVRSPGVMLGYLDDPAATAAVLRAGWLWTGDRAWRDAAGFYYLVGRRGLLINVGSMKVAPEEVEAVLLQHPGVREAVVLPAVDRLRGEVVRAVIVPTESVPDAQELRRFCRARLASYKVPRRIEFREALPHSAFGKVLRQQV